MSDDVDVADYETNINILFNMALRKLVFMPFGYVVDKYRWDLFSGLSEPEDLNCHWVKLRMDIQGQTRLGAHIVFLSFFFIH